MAFAWGAGLRLMRQWERNAMNLAINSRCWPRRIFFTALDRLCFARLFEGIGFVDQRMNRMLVKEVVHALGNECGATVLLIKVPR
jgi:hypothetical protein